MNPGNPQIVKCPFCGNEKMLMSLISGNTFGAIYWSDNKRDAPMLPQVSYVQKCPKCGKYYIKARQEAKCAADGFCLELGTLTYPEMKEAFAQLSDEGFNDVDEECSVRVLLLHTYNDYFFRGESDKQPSEIDKEFIVKNIHWLIENWAQDEIFKAELYREAGDMDEAIKILDNVDATEEFLAKIKNEIIRLAKAGDSSVFVITNL